MTLTELTAISPIDGRYRRKVKELSEYFSEEALIKYRVLVEVEYFIALSKKIPQLEKIGNDKLTGLRELYINFKHEDALTIKEIEKTTNHDVKAVEYFIKKAFDNLGLENHKEFIHFGLTSQDINNTAIPLSLKEAFEKVYLPNIISLVSKIKDLSSEWKEIPMLARTHGQPATPTRLGKEFAVFSERLEEQLRLLFSIPFAAKFGGATGNYNAHFIAYPDVDWKHFGTTFVEEKLGLHHSFPTTQIEHYDHIAALFDAFKRINTILLDLNRDIWSYISMDYFKQKIKEGEIGSSAMPHKVNPIDFENSEGNLGIANALFEHLSAKLPVSRLQRDLTDSTVLRNIGVPIAHTIIAFEATMTGLNKLLLNEKKIQEDLDNNWAVVAEAIQTILRREGYPNPYETLKGLTRTNSVINKDSIQEFIKTLEVSENVRNELLAITPNNYLGLGL
ncbi:MAG: adenylosuccinate lyase [Flavobacteriaceae bacterium]|jgi:adenylosuccinate lyase|nr:adenylosuccinate lyase [Flavobacteriaceae bacterium]